MRIHWYFDFECDTKHVFADYELFIVYTFRGRVKKSGGCLESWQILCYIEKLQLVDPPWSPLAWWVTLLLSWVSNTRQGKAMQGTDS